MSKLEIETAPGIFQFSAHTESLFVIPKRIIHALGDENNFVQATNNAVFRNCRHDFHVNLSDFAPYKLFLKKNTYNTHLVPRRG